MLQSNSIQCILVFDGNRLSMKKKVDENRKKFRDESLKLAQELLSKGSFNEASKKYIEAIIITPEMVNNFIQSLKREKV